MLMWWFFCSPLSWKLRTVLPSSMSFWFLCAPSATDTKLNRSNINCGAFLCGENAGARGKSFNSKGASLTAPPGAHLRWRAARKRQRRRGPAGIFTVRGLIRPPARWTGDKEGWCRRWRWEWGVGGGWEGGLPFLAGCPCIQLTSGGWLAPDWVEEERQREGENEPRLD